MSAADSGQGQDGRPRISRTSRAWIVIAVILAGALGVIALGALMAPDRQHDMWVEFVSRASQLVVLALAGGVVGAVVHDRDAAREDRQRRQAALLSFVDELEAAYGQVKTARRSLRAHGLDAPRATRLTSDQVIAFRTQMASLNESELQFERLARRVQAVPRPFGDAHAGISMELGAVHPYLNAVLHDWQSEPAAMAGGGTNAALGDWPAYALFVGYGESAERSFREGVVDHVDAVERVVLRLAGEG